MATILRLDIEIIRVLGHITIFVVALKWRMHWHDPHLSQHSCHGRSLYFTECGVIAPLWMSKSGVDVKPPMKLHCNNYGCIQILPIQFILSVANMLRLWSLHPEEDHPKEIVNTDGCEDLAEQVSCLVFYAWFIFMLQLLRGRIVGRAYICMFLKSCRTPLMCLVSSYQLNLC